MSEISRFQFRNIKFLCPLNNLKPNHYQLKAGGLLVKDLANLAREVSTQMESGRIARNNNSCIPLASSHFVGNLHSRNLPME
jgi:hypothetical protein